MRLRPILLSLSIAGFFSVVGATSAPPANSYEEVKDWPRLPATVQLGEVSGVAIDTNGHVFVFHRPGRGFDPQATEVLKEHAILELDADSGNLLNSPGANIVLVPHGITVDRANNVWVNDVGLQQVMKFSHDGKQLLTLGEARVAGWDAGHFNQPTDIAIRDDGSFYVSDGYVNSRVAFFDVSVREDWKSTRLNSSHLGISFVFFCLYKNN